MTSALEDRATVAAEKTAGLAAKGVDMVMITWVDNAGVARAKGIPLSRFERAARWGVGLSPVFHVFLVNDHMTSSPHIGGPSGDLRLVPDPDAARPMACIPGWAWAPADEFTQEAKPFAACQRSFLRRMVNRAEAAGLGFRMSFEIEWFLAERGVRERSPVHQGPAVGAVPLVQTAGFARELVKALEEEGLAPEAINAEYARGQMEVSLGISDPVAAADASVLARQTIHGLAAAKGLAASFAPVFGEEAGNGGHLHMSVWSADRNLFQGGSGPHGITDTGAAFLAGVLRELPALVAVGSPTAASYLRLQPSHWAGAYACWGLENREAAARLVTGMLGNREQAANVEIKCFDQACNPYALLGSVIAAGLSGIENGWRLPPEILDDPATRTDPELAELGVHRLPASLNEAVTQLEKSDVIRDAMGAELFGAVIAVRRAEAELFSDRAEEEIVQSHIWRY